MQRPRAPPARAAALLLLLAAAATPAAVRAKAVGFAVEDGPAAMEAFYGCYPATFSGPAPTRYIASPVVKAEPATACDGALDPEDVGGAAVLIDRGDCTFEDKWRAALEGGAAAVMIASNNPGEIPFEMITTTPVDESEATIPACMVSFSTGKVLTDSIQHGREVRVRFGPGSGGLFADPAPYSLYNPELEVLPDNPHTWVSVVSPAALKWQYPVGQATFNPRSWPGDTSDVVFAEFTPDCRGSTYEQCQACWEAGDIFSNRAAMEGNIVVYRFNTPARVPSCWVTFHELAYLAQRAGAVASIVTVDSSPSLYTLVPYLTPYEITVPMYSALDDHLALWDGVVADGVQVDVHVPAIEQGSGPDFFLTIDAEGALPEALVTLSTPGGSPTTRSIRAGQAAFNPRDHPVSTSPVKRANVIVACHLLENEGDDVGDVSGGLGPTGVNCDACHAAQLDGPAGVFTNAATLDGKVALVNAEHTFCFPSWRSLTDSLADAGAVGVLIGAETEMTLTLPTHDDEDDRAAIPTFVVRRSDRDALMTASVSSPADNRVQLPALDAVGLSEVTAPTVHSPSAQLDLAEVRVTQPESIAGLYDAGQALFNPDSHPGVTGEVWPAVHSFGCDGSIGECHSCDFLFSPIDVNDDAKAAIDDGTPVILLIDTTAASCIRPLYNYVDAAKALGAVGVVFGNDGEHLLAMGPARPVDDDSSSDSGDGEGANAVLPAFNVMASVAELFTAAADAGTPATATLPKIVAGSSLNGGGSRDVLGQQTDPHGARSGRDDRKGASVGAIAAGVAAAAAVVGCCVGFRWFKVRRERRLFAFNRADAAVGDDFDDVGLVMGDAPVGNSDGEDEADGGAAASLGLGRGKRRDGFTPLRTLTATPRDIVADGGGDGAGARRVSTSSSVMGASTGMGTGTGTSSASGADPPRRGDDVPDVDSEEEIAL